MLLLGLKPGRVTNIMPHRRAAFTIFRLNYVGALKAFQGKPMVGGDGHELCHCIDDGTYH
jgi:hypothetical protein